MLSLTTPTHKQKLLSFGIIQAWYHLLPHSFLPTSPSSLQWHHISQVVYPGPTLWGIIWSNSSPPLATLWNSPTGIAPLCCTALEASAEHKLDAHCILVISTTAGSYVKCSSRINQMQHACPTTRTQEKQRKKITHIHLKLYWVFQVKKLNRGWKTKQLLTTQSANLSQWAFNF